MDVLRMVPVGAGRVVWRTARTWLRSGRGWPQAHIDMQRHCTSWPRRGGGLRGLMTSWTFWDSHEAVGRRWLISRNQTLIHLCVSPCLRHLDRFQLTVVE